MGHSGLSGYATLVAMSGIDVQALEAEGYLLLRGAIPADWLAPLQQAFDAGVLPSGQWPVPRGPDWRHSALDTHPLVQRLCRLPELLDGVRHILRQPFFLAQVEGREPIANNRPQPMHRDGGGFPGQVMAAMAWLDPYGADNGATQIVPGSHRISDADALNAGDGGLESIVISGDVGDILLFDPEVMHGATTNISGARRRSLLISYAAESLRTELQKTAALRNIGMDTSEVFL
jgi:hypothetical protein